MSESSPEEKTPVFGLLWGLKYSFVDYVRRMPDGQGTVTDGARPVGNYEVLYPPETAGRRPAEGGGEERYWTFRGDLRFSGHYGMLSVRIASPRVHLLGDVAELDIADPTPADAEARLTLVTLRLVPKDNDEGVELWTGSDVRLTEAGAAVFNDVYQPGEPFENLLIALPVTEP